MIPSIAASACDQRGEYGKKLTDDEGDVKGGKAREIAGKKLEALDPEAMDTIDTKSIGEG